MLICSMHLLKKKINSTANALACCFRRNLTILFAGRIEITKPESPVTFRKMCGQERRKILWKCLQSCLDCSLRWHPEQSHQRPKWCTVSSSHVIWGVPKLEMLDPCLQSWTGFVHVFNSLVICWNSFNLKKPGCILLFGIIGEEECNKQDNYK